LLVLAACSPAEESTRRAENIGNGGSAQDGSAQGGSAQGGSAQGGSAQGGSAQGGSAQGGAVSSAGGDANGGTQQTGGAAAKGGANSAGGGSGGSAGKSGSGGSSSGSGGTSHGGSSGSAGASGTPSASGGSATCAGFVLCDDFEDRNLTANPAWIATPSAYTVTNDGSNVLTQRFSGEAWAYAGEIGWTNVTIEARVKVTNFGGTSSSYCGGLIARWRGSSNPNYQANLCANGTVGIYKDGGPIDESTGTKNVGIVANTWYTLKFKVAGAAGKVALSLSVNEVQAISITDTDTSAAVESGYVALGSKKTLTMEFDDVKVSIP
jgi:hypothetical protein